MARHKPYEVLRCITTQSPTTLASRILAKTKILAAVGNPSPPTVSSAAILPDCSFYLAL
jgi:hypothetical protein